MKIPTSFVLGGTTWKVEQAETLPGCMGLSNNQEATIHLLKSLKQDVKEQTFFHELGHAIYYAMGIDAPDHDEILIDGYATFMHQFTLTQK